MHLPTSKVLPEQELVVICIYWAPLVSQLANCYAWYNNYKVIILYPAEMGMMLIRHMALDYNMQTMRTLTFNPLPALMYEQYLAK